MSGDIAAIPDTEHIALTIAEYRAAIRAVIALRDQQRAHREAGVQIQTDLDQARQKLNQIGKEITLMTTGMTIDTFCDRIY